MSAGQRVPLFINRFSLSPRTAIGVQTLRLMEPHQDSLHFHWWSSSLKQMDPRSVLFENTLLSRYSFLHNPSLLRVCERLGISLWDGNDLRAPMVERLKEYRERVSSAYIAPLSEPDAQRCLELANLVGSSRETITRMLSRFKRDKLIEVRGASILILSPERLEQLSA